MCHTDALSMASTGLTCALHWCSFVLGTNESPGRSSGKHLDASVECM